MADLQALDKAFQCVMRNFVETGQAPHYSQLATELDQAISNMEEDDGVGAIVITGAGERAFSAGADIHENRELADEERERITGIRADYTWHLATSTNR